MTQDDSQVCYRQSYVIHNHPAKSINQFINQSLKSTENYALFYFSYFKSFFERDVVHIWILPLFTSAISLFTICGKHFIMSPSVLSWEKQLWQLYIPSVYEITICLNIFHDGRQYIFRCSLFSDSLRCYFLLAQSFRLHLSLCLIHRTLPCCTTHHNPCYNAQYEVSFKS